MLVQRQGLQTWGACDTELPVLHGGWGEEAVLCHSSTLPLPSGWPSVSSSTWLCGSETTPARKKRRAITRDIARSA